MNQLMREISILAGAFVIICVPSLGLPERALLPYRQHYGSLRDAVYDQNTSMETMRSMYHTARETVMTSSLVDGERLYWLSLVEYMLGRAYRNENDKETAASHYEVGLEYVKGSLRNGEYSEGYRLMGEIIGQMCVVKSLPFTLKNGMKSKRFAERAIELDPLNAKAHIIIASSLIYPPAAFGGSPEEGIERMKKALAMPGNEKDDLFNIYSGIGIGYSKLKRPQQARVWLERALELYPNNKYVKKEYKSLGE